MIYAAINQGVGNVMNQSQAYELFSFYQSQRKISGRNLFDFRPSIDVPMKGRFMSAEWFFSLLNVRILRLP